ncbi:MAG: replication initiation protein, partial [Propionibacteriales bacterium]|nr:replication initiation protein [Propionibacteriales bacterium]
MALPHTAAANPDPVMGSRAERARLPVARQVVEAVAVKYGVCVHPIPVRRVDPETGTSDIVDVPCGATVTSKCPACAERARLLRITQCRQGWHLEAEPILEPDDPSDDQQELATLRADLEAVRTRAVIEGKDTVVVQAAIERVDDAMTAAGVRGNFLPSHARRRVRSTRRRQDAPDLPPTRVSPTTIGRTFAGKAGKVFRPSVFVTLTCRSYGRVDEHGVPRDMNRYDYVAAARDAIHFPKAVDRIWQNLRRVAGYEVQYFAVLEPQRRLAPHLHAALRGTISRVDLRLVAAATYHQVWWPSTDTVVYHGPVLPVWDELRGYVDPATGEPLATWDEAMDCLDADANAQPSHVVRF